VAGLIQQLKISGWRETDLTTVSIFVVQADCIDKGVTTAIIDFGFAVTSETANDAALRFVANMSSIMVHHRNDFFLRQPSDTRTAFAIRAGLITLCLNLINSYGGNILPIGKANELFQSIQRILGNVYSVSLQTKTAKAIASQRLHIKQKLLHSEDNKDVVSNANCRKLLGMVTAILNLNGSYCCRCNKSLSKTEVKECNGCHQMTYCSRAFQKEDWLNGHEKACCKSYTDNQSGKFQGRVWPRVLPESERATALLKDLEINLTMVQLKVCLDNMELILGQTNSLDTPLYDCVVQFDLRACPPVVAAIKYTNYFARSDTRRI